MFLLKRYAIWLRRFRNRCGYGVHSPFAFNFITGVVYERGIYYAYASLNRAYGGSFGPFLLRRTRECRLLFRVANYVRPSHLYMWKPTEAESAYLRAGCVHAEAVCLSDCSRIADDSLVDMCYVSVADGFDTCYANLLAHTHSSSVWVMAGIYDSAERRTMWRRLQTDERVGVTFDLYDYGIAFFDRSLNKQHYVVNF